MTFDVHQVKILKMLPDQVNSMCSSSPKVLMQTLNAKISLQHEEIDVQRKERGLPRHFFAGSKPTFVVSEAEQEQALSDVTGNTEF